MVSIARILGTAAFVMLGMGGQLVRAADPFNVTLDVDGQSSSKGFTDLANAVNLISSTTSLQTLIPGYTEVAGARLDLNLRGLAATGSFDAGSPVLRVVIPAAGVNEVFAGATRNESGRLFRKWLERNADAVVRAGAKETSTDPVAGNPNSGDDAAGDLGFQPGAGRRRRLTTGGFGLDARFGSFAAGGYRSNAFTLPINQAWQVSERDVLQIDVPISFTDLDGAQSYGANIGLLWRRRVTPRWTLQPSLRIGGVGSVNLGSGAGVWSAALNSMLNLDLPGTWQLTVANGISYVSTIPVSVGRYSLNYDISNVVFRNGLVASRDLGFRVANYPVRGALFAIDTRFTGDAIYIENFQEFGAFFILGTPNPIRFGVTYLTGGAACRASRSIWEPGSEREFDGPELPGQRGAGSLATRPRSGWERPQGGRP
ncbi:hypothetical protein [Dankookia sp. P2]|uniref:hypothetical protein n=1 Tax=Dankookia sp. P2 TaxID=3423955 RepID=UPI003D66EDAA